MAEALLHRRYRLLGRIGEGAMGTVHLAEDSRLPGRRCAIKESRLPAGLDDDAARSLRASFLGEAAILAQLDHPGLPKVSDHFEAEGRAWLVMDLISGQDLRAVLADALARRRQLEHSQLLGWALAACDILAYLAGQSPPIVHGDIKPANLKLTPDGQLKLVDFGLARGTTTTDGPTLTMVVAGGSRPYQPLEQYGDATAVDGRSDLYALGATLYHLLTGKAPPAAQDRFLHRQEMEPPRALRPDLPASFERAILSAMALHPDERPASAEDLRRRLLSPEMPEPQAWTSAMQRNGGLILLVMTLLLAALVMSFG
jgi:serine/threonine-protein kinase